MTLAAMRAHTITATPMANGRGGLQYHCTTCGTLTYFQPPTLPCLGSLSEAHAKIEALQQTINAMDGANISALRAAGVWDVNLGVVRSIEAMAAEIERLQVEIDRLEGVLETERKMTENILKDLKRANGGRGAICRASFSADELAYTVAP